MHLEIFRTLKINQSVLLVILEPVKRAFNFFSKCVDIVDILKNCSEFGPNN